MSGIFEYLFSKRERTKNRSDNLFKKITILFPISSVFFNATISLSALLAIVLHMCKRDAPLDPPGKMKFF